MMGLCWQFHGANLIKTLFIKALLRVQITGHLFIYYLLFIYLFISLTAII